MKLSLAIAILLGVVVARKDDDTKASASKSADPDAKPKDYFRDDPRLGTPDAPLSRGGGGMAKPTKKFEVPKNT